MHADISAMAFNDITSCLNIKGSKRPVCMMHINITGLILRANSCCLQNFVGKLDMHE